MYDDITLGPVVVVSRCTTCKFLTSQRRAKGRIPPAQRRPVVFAEAVGLAVREVHEVLGSAAVAERDRPLQCRPSGPRR